MNTSLFDQLHERFPELPWQREVPLAPMTYMKIGGPAEVLWEAQSLDMLRQVTAFCRANDLPLTILGGASNVLVADEGLRGLTIFNHCDDLIFYKERSELPVETFPILEKVAFPSGKSLVLAESGIKTAALVGATTAASLTGLEPFLGVPGTIGGAIYNNSHYTDELIGQSILAVEILDEAGERRWFSQEECRFAYDASRFQDNQEVILRAIFQLQEADREMIQEKLKITTVKRATTQPLGTANSGCMFQNVQLSAEQAVHFGGRERLSAGWLIDQAGLKGLRVGKAVVSNMHANFIINEGGARSNEVEELISLVQRKVKEKFGIQLQREVFFLQQPQMLK